MRVVLDSYAVLAYMNDEPAAEKVEEYLNLGRSGRAELYFFLLLKASPFRAGMQ